MKYFHHKAFLLSLIMGGLFFLASNAYPFEPEDIKIHGEIITDFLRDQNSDDTFPHYATESGINFISTVNESRFSITGKSSGESGTKTSFKTEFDFMGNNGFEIVSAWIRLEKGKFCLIAGKTESLVATGETTLNYDGFYSAGGIQTGANANQNQIQWRIKLNRHLKLAISLTDEPAQNGSIDGEPFNAERPGIEAAFLFNSDQAKGKIAVHHADMRLHSGAHFHPGIIMTEWNFPVSETISWLVSGFRAQAGSQFFTIDLLSDCVQLPDGRIYEFTSAGGLTQLIFTKGNCESWIGIGNFSLTGHFESYLREQHSGDTLTHNHRISTGARYHFSGNFHIGLEFTWYKSTHLIESDTLIFHGKSVQLQTSLNF